jgi:UDP-2-acetamido-3-amino-2,3-dideoxy-glucuronate N-acetyltransferase
VIGERCVLGQNVFVANRVIIGDNVKIQNNVSIYDDVVLENNVFCGPSCVFTNVNNPRAGIERKDEYRKTLVKQGATIGANATIVCGHVIGEYALIGAGAVVTKDVLPHALMVGVPARQVGWVSHAGEILDDSLKCPREGRQYSVVEGALVAI